MSAIRKIVILGTGGTIAGQGDAHGGGVGYRPGQIDVAQLIQPVLTDRMQGSFHFEVQQVAQIDSKDMDIETWQALAIACQHWLLQDAVAAVVITHGTDTLEESAWFLQSALAPDKPVVLTCAMRPATALSADGPANLRDALLCAAQAPVGVWTVAAGEVHAAQWVRKVHPYRVHAFASGAQGPAGFMEEGLLRWNMALPGQSQIKPQGAGWMVDAARWPWVEIVTSTAAARGAAVDALVAAGVRGLVVAGTGNGSVHWDLQQSLNRAAAQGVAILRTTRCEQGQVVQSEGARDPGVTSLSPVKARISLMLELLPACA